VISVGVAMAVPSLLLPKISAAQAGTDGSTPADASTRATAKKLSAEGNAAFEAQKFGQAIALYMRAFTLEPHPLLLFNVGQSHRLAGCPQRAASFYERYLALDPKGAQSEAAKALLAEFKQGQQHDGVTCSSLAGSEEGALESTPAATGQLKLSSTPGGLVVMIDGVKVGVTPLEHELAAGSHMVALVQDGRLLEERKVELGAGTVTEVTIRVELPNSDSQGRSPSRVAPTLFWVGGGLALAGSGVAFYLGQQGGSDHPEDKYVYRGATATSFALAGTGAAAIGAGIWLWFRGSRKSAPIIAVERASAYFGWKGRF
jgi:hypothetical protein